MNTGKVEMDAVAQKMRDVKESMNPGPALATCWWCQKKLPVYGPNTIARHYAFHSVYYHRNCTR